MNYPLVIAYVLGFIAIFRIERDVANYRKGELSGRALAVCVCWSAVIFAVGAISLNASRTYTQ